MTTSKRSQYFVRTVVYARRGESVVLVDMHDTSLSEPLEPWLGRVFLLADGTHTIEELIDFIRRQYGARVPPKLDATIDSVIERLQASGTIAFSDAPVELPYYLALPADQQDPERANRLMLEHGFQQGRRGPPGAAN